VLWLADECVDASLVAQLRRTGEDVAYVAEFSSGLSDAEAIALAQRERRLLLTEDKDFGDLVFRQGRPVPGVLLLRIEPDQREIKWPRLQFVIARLGDGLFGRYTVLEPTRFRSRRLIHLTP
jgi:predicted nuclease of predicted toxin-antitoxin system